jgi:hypothetical protein
MLFIATGTCSAATSPGAGWCYSRVRRGLLTGNGGAARGTILCVESEDFCSVDEAARILKRREHLRKLSTVDATMCDPSPPAPLRVLCYSSLGYRRACHLPLENATLPSLVSCFS